MNKRRYAVLLLSFFIIPLLFSQERQGRFVSFDNNWTIDLSLNFNFLQFDQENLFSCRGNKPLDIGIGLRYKKIALEFNVTLPFFTEFYHASSESFDLNFNYIENKYIINTFFSRYNSFFIKNYQIMDTAVPVTDTDVDLGILSTGASFRWILNSEIHSLRGVYKLDRQQTVSSGSLTLGVGIYYHSLYSADKNLPGYETKQHFIYTGPLVGYSYTWIFKNNAFFNIDVAGGINPGLNASEKKFVFIPALFPNATFGYHFKTWSIATSLSIRYFIAIQSYQIYSADLYQMSKIHLTIFKVSKRF